MMGAPPYWSTACTPASSTRCRQVNSPSCTTRPTAAAGVVDDAGGRWPYDFAGFPPFFDGVLPEGPQLEALLRHGKLDRDDLLGQLLYVGGDLVGGGHRPAAAVIMTRRCPLTYEPLGPAERAYSAKGLRALSPRLRHLGPLAGTAATLRREASARASKMSVQGVQLKLSARLDVGAGRFLVVDRDGHYILKPPHLDYPEVPANEDLTMRLAAACGIEAGLHGLLWGEDGDLTYMIRRFDRVGRAGRLLVEDFAQLAGASREAKYRSTVERVVALADAHCTFPRIERHRLFTRLLFCFLVGNEDMHLKNFSLITRAGVTGLAPAYDLLNTTVLLAHPAEEMALPLGGKKSRLGRRDFLDYFARDRLALSTALIDDTLASFDFDAWQSLLSRSFLSPAQQAAYWSIVTARRAALQL